MSLHAELLHKITNKKVVIWGARMTGLGFARFLKSNTNSQLLAFIDSDTSLHNKKINGTAIASIETLKKLKKKYPDLLIVIAVSLKESEITAILEKIGFSQKDYLVYSDYAKDFYTIDVVGSCNLKCPSCAHGASGMESPMGLMGYEDFERVTTKMIQESEVLSHVSLYSWGEPLLHHKLPEMIGHLHKKGIAVAISSNLSIENAKQIEKVIKSAPDYFKVSLSGFYPEAYNDTHTGGDIRLVKSNLYKLRYLIDKYNVSTLVDVNYHLYNNNCEKNLQKMQELCDELDFTLSSTYSLVMPLERVIAHCEGHTSQEVLELDNKLLVTMDEGIRASEGIQLEECPFRENQVNINWDLSVPVCCTVYNRNPDTVLTPNYLQTSLSAITQKKYQVSLCSKCMAYGLPQYNMGFNKEKWREIAQSKESFDV